MEFALISLSSSFFVLSPRARMYTERTNEGDKSGENVPRSRGNRARSSLRNKQNALRRATSSREQNNWAPLLLIWSTGTQEITATDHALRGCFLYTHDAASGNGPSFLFIIYIQIYKAIRACSASIARLHKAAGARAARGFAEGGKRSSLGPADRR